MAELVELRGREP